MISAKKYMPEKQLRQRIAAGRAGGHTSKIPPTLFQSAEGQKILHRLVARADVLLHNFRPGVPERLCIDWDTCRQINPRLIHLYVGAYGATGPLACAPKLRRNEVEFVAL
jgi:hypothetical protein